MPAFRKKPTYVKQRKRKNTRAIRSKAARILRMLVLIVGALLLVVPVLVVAHPITYVPLVMVVLVVLVSWAYLRIVYRCVSVHLEQPAFSCERGQDAGLTVSLANTSFLPVARVELRFTISNLFGDEDDSRVFACSLAPNESTDVAFDAGFGHLGTYTVGIRDVTVHDLLGVFSRTHKDTQVSQVVVRPARVNLGTGSATQVVPDESSRALKPIPSDNEDYSSVREYHRGDPLKTVHWNLSSRNPDGTLYTRLFEEYVNPSLVVVIDCCSPEADDETLMSLFDGVVETAVALSMQAHSAGVDAEIRFCNREGEQALARVVTDDDVDSLVESMHRITPTGKAGEVANEAEQMLRAAGLQNHGFGNVAYVSARIDEGCLTALRDIRMRKRNAMAYIAVPRDMEDVDRAKLLAPISALSMSGVSAYAVESSPLRTEVGAV